MAVIDRRGKPLPANHPFKGTRIIFGGPQQNSSAKNSNSAPQDPMLPAMNGLEDWLQAESVKYQATEPQAPVQSKQPESTTPDQNEAT